jgi:hypothetical protein
VHYRAPTNAAEADMTGDAGYFIASLLASAILLGWLFFVIVAE